MDLDTSWIREMERIHQLTENPPRENISYLNVISIYINMQNYIDSFDKNTVKITGNILTKELLLQMSQTKRKISPSKYVLKELLIYHVPIEPEHVNAFISSETDTFFHVHSNILEDISLPPSLFIFHSINTMYLIFHEMASNHKTKSILRTGPLHLTKKVQIKERKTRKC